MIFMHPTNPQIRNLTDIIVSNVVCLNLRQYIVSNDIISMNNGDNFIKFAG